MQCLYFLEVGFFMLGDMGGCHYNSSTRISFWNSYFFLISVLAEMKRKIILLIKLRTKCLSISKFQVSLQITVQHPKCQANLIKNSNSLNHISFVLKLRYYSFNKAFNLITYTIETTSLAPCVTIPNDMLRTFIQKYHPSLLVNM